MRGKWRVWLSVVPAAFLFTAGPAIAQSAAQLDALEAALERRDPYAMHELLEDITFARRPADGALRLDSLLSGYIGRVTLVSGRASVALPFLERAQGADVPDLQRIEAGFALAEAYDLTGSPEGARILEGLARASLTSRQRHRLALMLASREMVGDPAAALGRLAALDPIEDPVLRFEADLLVARARSLAGDPSAAREAAARAWSSAALQPAHVLGPMRAALVMAGMAADASDRDRALAMLTVTRAADVTVDRGASAFLPICGEEGVTPDDRVIFAAYRDLDWQQLVPVSASRLAVVAPFVRALTGRTIVARRSNTPAGTLVAVRCRSVPSAEWREVALVDPTARVFAENGVYLPGNAEWDGERVSAVEQSIADITARHGADHPALVQPLAELIERVAERVRSSGASTTDLDDLNRRMIAAMRNLEGADQIMLVTASEQAAMLAATDDPERSQALWESMMIDRIGRADFARAFELTQLLTDGNSGADEATKRRIVSALLQRASVGPTDIRRRTLLMRLGEIQTEAGEFDGAVASYRAAGVSADNCLVVHNGLRISVGEISSDAYPEWAARYGAAGTTAIEYGVDAEGRVVHSRVVYSTPGGLFDAVATEAFRASYRLVPRRPGSRPRSCLGPVVSIHWRMADEDEEVPVPFDMFEPDPI